VKDLTTFLLDRCIRHVRRATRRLAEEHGISLLLALIVLCLLSTVGGGVAVYTSSNLRHTYTDQSSASAYHLAQAGLAEGLARLQGADDPTVSTDLPATTRNDTSLGGTYTYSGSSIVGPGTDNDRVTWTITSKGTTGNPVRTQTLTQTVLVRPTVPGADIGSWSRFYQGDATKCLTIDTVAMPAPIATPGDLCLVNGGSITGASTSVDVGGKVVITGPEVDSGPRNPGTAAGWTNPTQGRTNDGLYATNAITKQLSGIPTIGATLTLTALGFSIPATAYIKGIRVDLQRHAGSSSSLRDNSVLLQKSSTVTSAADKAVTGSSWSTSDITATYGSTTDMWGSTWTPAEINSANFGVRFQAKNINTSSTVTAYLDYVQVTVSYYTDTNGIGTAAAPIHDATIGSTCQYNGQTAHIPCTPIDHVNASTVTTAALDPKLVLPVLDLDNAFLNSRPGPKHPCTNAGNGLAPLEFDNDNSAQSNDSLLFDNSSTYDMTPLGRDYDCQVVTNGVLLGRLAWNHTTHVLTVGGSIFFDGDVRFDDDGQLIHYQGRALIYAAGDVEFDELVCAGGTGTAQSCVNSMSSWDPTKNLLTLQAQGNSEYDQGGSGCSNLAAGVTCNGIHPQSGFQGIVSAQGTCLIHERFFLSGPVLCNDISLPYQSDGWPTYYPFPSLGSLTDGQKYGNLPNATSWEIAPGPQSG